MLDVQKYLLSGKTLQDLIDNFSIKVRIDNNLNVVCLNYDQINSPMGNSIVEECRALILELDTWEVLSWPFRKFYNYSEGHIPVSFNWNQFDALNKLDGSLISLWFDSNYNYHFATRSVPDASCSYDESDNTFKALIEQAILEMTGNCVNNFLLYFCPGHSYTFELTTPENKMVVQHTDRKLTLLAIRNLETLEELDVNQWVLDNLYPYPVVQGFKNLTLYQVKEKVASINPLKEEGFVLLDNNFNRIKIKSEAYLPLSKCRDSLGKSAKARLETILMDKLDDVWSTQPVWIQDKLTETKIAVKILNISINTSYSEVKHMSSQKEFAMAIKNLPYFDALFSLRKNKIETAMEWIVSTGLRNPKSMLEIIKKTVATLDIEDADEN